MMVSSGNMAAACSQVNHPTKTVHHHHHHHQKVNDEIHFSDKGNFQAQSLLICEKRNVYYANSYLFIRKYNGVYFMKARVHNSVQQYSNIGLVEGVYTWFVSEVCSFAGALITRLFYIFISLYHVNPNYFEQGDLLTYTRHVLIYQTWM